MPQGQNQNPPNSRDTQDGQDWGNYQGGSTTNPSSGPGKPACGPGTFETSLDVNGNHIEGGWECVDEAEATRRGNINYPAQNTNGTPAATQAAVGPTPAGKPNYGNAPVFTPPQFTWGEQWQAPSAADALNDPGYQFRADEGQKALQQSAAAKGILGSGGTLKDINAWGQNFAKQEYGDVFNRALTGYNTRFGTAKDVFDRYYTGQKDAYAPKLFEWQTNAHGADLGWQQAWDNYWKNNLTAQDIWSKSA